MIWRILAVAAVLAAALVVVRLSERRTTLRSVGAFATGLTLVTGADCRLCPMAVAATDGAGVPVTIVDIADLPDSGVKSVPTAVVADRDGSVIASRSGRSAITGMAELGALARGVA